MPAELAPPVTPDLPSEDYPNRWKAFVPIALVSIASTLNSSVINVSLPVISVELRAGIGVVEWTIMAFLLAVTSLLMIAGRLGDLLGRRRIYQSGIILGYYSLYPRFRFVRLFQQHHHVDRLSNYPGHRRSPDGGRRTCPDR